MSQQRLFPTPRRYWLGVVSRTHVARGVAGGFAQVCHGKAGPLQRMTVGDGFVYYSPKTDMTDGEPLQQFTAIGQVSGEAAYPFAMAPDFVPHRRDIRWFPAQATPIQPLLPRLSFVTDLRHWGYALRAGHLELTAEDFSLIATAMQAEKHEVSHGV